jgi:hypothetical protein
MSSTTDFDEIISEFVDLSKLSNKGYNFKLQQFVLNDTKNLDEWNTSIDGVAEIIKNHPPTSSLKIICIRG